MTISKKELLLYQLKNEQKRLINRREQIANAIKQHEAILFSAGEEIDKLTRRIDKINRVQDNLRFSIKEQSGSRESHTPDEHPDINQ